MSTSPLLLLLLPPYLPPSSPSSYSFPSCGAPLLDMLVVPSRVKFLHIFLPLVRGASFSIFFFLLFFSSPFLFFTFSNHRLFSGPSSLNIPVFLQPLLFSSFALLYLTSLSHTSSIPRTIYRTPLSPTLSYLSYPNTDPKCGTPLFFLVYHSLFFHSTLLPRSLPTPNNNTRQPHTMPRNQHSPRVKPSMSTARGPSP